MSEPTIAEDEWLVSWWQLASTMTPGRSRDLFVAMGPSIGLACRVVDALRWARASGPDAQTGLLFAASRLWVLRGKNTKDEFMTMARLFWELNERSVVYAGQAERSVVREGRR